jgi:hypothetical protein
MALELLAMSYPAVEAHEGQAAYASIQNNSGVPKDLALSGW